MCYLHIEISQLICCANQLAGFYMRTILALNGFTNVEISTFVSPSRFDVEIKKKKQIMATAKFLHYTQTQKGKAIAKLIALHTNAVSVILLSRA